MWPYSRIRPGGGSERAFSSRRLIDASRRAQSLNTISGTSEAQLNDANGGSLPESIPIQDDLLPLPDDGRLSVVGESHYQAALKIAVGGRTPGDDLFSHIPATAAMVPEPENPHDANAVRIDIVIDNHLLTVGYLARDVAPRYQRVLLGLRNRGILGTCPARITGGGKNRYFGIYLHVVSAEWLGELESRGAFDGEQARARVARAAMSEPEELTVIRFNTSHKGDGYTYVAVRVANARPGDTSWYVTTSQPVSCSCDNCAQIASYFPFGGCVTWAEILEFAGDHRIDIATQWETHPDWRKPPWLDRWLERQSSTGRR